MLLQVFRFVFLLVIATGAFASKSLHATYTSVGTGAPIVLIHAFPTDQRLWQPQQDELRKNFRVITLDMRGFGQAGATDGSAIAMTEYADQVKGLLDKLQIHKAIIGGESMGGYIALAFLEKYPDSVSGLILSDTQAIADSPEMQEKREQSARDVLINGTGTLINNFMSKALSLHARNDVKSNLKNIVEAQSATGIASALRGMAIRHDTSYLLSKSSVPILIISGEQDTLISPEQSNNMHSLTSNSTLVVIPDAGHLSNLEQPELWNKAVRDRFANRE